MIIVKSAVSYFFVLIHSHIALNQSSWNETFRNLNIKIMETQEQIKEMVRQKYSEIALQDKESNETSCCGSGCCTTDVYNIMTDDYTNLKGYNPEADLGLGCGLPTQFAKIKKGDLL